MVNQKSASRAEAPGQESTPFSHEPWRYVPVLCLCGALGGGNPSRTDVSSPTGPETQSPLPAKARCSRGDPCVTCTLPVAGRVGPGAGHSAEAGWPLL